MGMGRDDAEVVKSPTDRCGCGCQMPRTMFDGQDADWERLFPFREPRVRYALTDAGRAELARAEYEDEYDYTPPEVQGCAWLLVISAVSAALFVWVLHALYVWVTR